MGVRFAGTKKSGRNNEVVVRRGSTVFRYLEFCVHANQERHIEVLIPLTANCSLRFVSVLCLN